MVRPLGTQPDTRAIAQPLAFGLFGWHFQPFAPPDPFDTLVIDLPERNARPSGRGQLRQALKSVNLTLFNASIEQGLIEHAAEIQQSADSRSGHIGEQDQ